MEDNALNIESILKECGVGEAETRLVVSNLSNLGARCSEHELVEIYNHILTTCNDIEILTCTVKLTSDIKDESTLPILLDMLLLKRGNIEENSDALINLRVACIKCIAEYKDKSSLSSLLYCLNNKNENYKIRLACADALGRIGDRYAVAPLINILKDEEEKSVYVKESATFALGLIGDDRAIEPLLSIMEAKQGILDKFTFLREKIIEALGRLNINNSGVYKVLKASMLDASPIVRINSIEALMNSEFEDAPELIRTALHDENEEVQRNALIALYNLQGRDVLDEVISLPGYSAFLKEEAKNMIEEYEDAE